MSGPLLEEVAVAVGHLAQHGPLDYEGQASGATGNPQQGLAELLLEACMQCLAAGTGVDPALPISLFAEK